MVYHGKHWKRPAAWYLRHPLAWQPHMCNYTCSDPDPIPAGGKSVPLLIFKGQLVMFHPIFPNQKCVWWIFKPFLCWNCPIHCDFSRLFSPSLDPIAPSPVRISEIHRSPDQHWSPGMDPCIWLQWGGGSFLPKTAKRCCRFREIPCV